MNDEDKKQRFYEVTGDVGRAFADLRRYYNLSIEEAAFKTGLSVSKINAIERGRLTVHLSVLTDFIERLGGRLAIIPEEKPDDPHCQFIEFED